MKIVKDIKLFESIKSFLTEYLPKVRSLSPNTILSYKHSLNLYMLFLRNQKAKDFSKVLSTDFSQENILEFLEWLKSERKCSIATCNQRLVGIRMFCKYLFKDASNYDTYAKITEIKPAKCEKVFCKVLTINQLMNLLALPNTSRPIELRDYFYMALLYDTGCRNDEILSMKASDLIIHKNGTGEVRVIGKGRKFRITPISREVIEAFKKYYGIFHQPYNQEKPLFYTKHADSICQMSPDNAARILNKYEEIAKNLDLDMPHLHPHLFRHTRAMHLYQAGMPLPLIGEWLGHANLETTLIYAYADTEMKRKAIEKISDANDTVFSNEEFNYKNDDEILKTLYGLS